MLLASPCLRHLRRSTTRPLTRSSGLSLGMRCSHYSWRPRFSPSGGTFTFVGSRSGIRPSPNQALYGAFKAALHHLVRVAAVEFGPHKIRVNAVAPGVVRTPRLLKGLPPDAWHQLALATPLRRVADPEDVAKAILFLASNLAGYVTGNILTLDGAGDSTFQSLGIKPDLPGRAKG